MFFSLGERNFRYQPCISGGIVIWAQLYFNNEIIRKSVSQICGNLSREMPR